MCYGCWTEAGKPQIDTPAVRAAAAAVAEVYEHSCVGGNLHIVLDDWNIEDDNLEFCRGCIEGKGAMPGIEEGSPHWAFNERRRANPDPPEQLAAEQKCYELFKALSLDERSAALALRDGFWEPPAADAVDPQVSSTGKPTTRA